MKNMRFQKKVALASVLTLAAGSGLMYVMGQVAPLDITTIEGSVTAINAGWTDPATGVVHSPTIDVMGVRFDVPAGTPVYNMARSGLTLTELRGAAFPGRTQNGFVGGTAIVQADTLNGINTAFDVFIEPNENVIAGPVTQNDAGGFAILGVPIVLLTDARMPGNVINIDGGFDTTLAGVAVGTFGNACGYYSALDGAFYAFLIEVDNTPTNTPQETVIARAQGRDFKDFKANGSSTQCCNRIDFYDATLYVSTDTPASASFLGSVVSDLVFDALGNPMGRWRLILDLQVMGRASPTSIIAVDSVNGSFDISDVVVR